MNDGRADRLLKKLFSGKNADGKPIFSDNMDDVRFLIQLNIDSQTAVLVDFRRRKCETLASPHLQGF